MLPPIAEQLALLSRDDLLAIASAACEQHPPTLSHANTLFSARFPLPAWIASDVLLSPDLMGKILSELSWRQRAAAARVCSDWNHNWRTVQMRYCGHVQGFKGPTGIAVLPSGVLVVANSQENELVVVNDDRSVEPIGTGLGWQTTPTFNRWPYSLAVDAAGAHLYVGETQGERRLLRIRISDGQVLNTTENMNVGMQDPSWHSGYPDIVYADGDLFAVHEQRRRPYYQMRVLDAETLVVRHTLDVEMPQHSIAQPHTLVAASGRHVFIGQTSNGRDVACIGVFEKQNDEWRKTRTIPWSQRKPTVMAADGSRLYIQDATRRHRIHVINALSGCKLSEIRLPKQLGDISSLVVVHRMLYATCFNSNKLIKCAPMEQWEPWGEADEIDDDNEEEEDDDDSEEDDISEEHEEEDEEEDEEEEEEDDDSEEDPIFPYPLEEDDNSEDEDA